MAKQQCETCKKWFDDEELDDHLEEHLKDQVEEPAPQMLKCSTCNIEMDAYFGVPFRVGGDEPAMRILYGSSSDEAVPVDLYLCPQCRRIQLLANEKTAKRLRRTAPHRP
jgi:hypothetical protein